MKTIILALGLLVLAGPPLLFAKQHTTSVSGYWTGNVGDIGELLFYLFESSSDSVAGWVVLDWEAGIDSLEIRVGKRPRPDSLYLDVSCLSGPPVGCTRILEGNILNEDQAVGVYYSHIGHNPPSFLPWSAVQETTPVDVETWGGIKRRYE